MFCPKCGSEVQEGSAFCGKCGAPVGAAAAQKGAGAGAAGAAASSVSAPKRSGAKIGVIAAAAVVVLLAVVGFATNGFGLGGVQPKEAVDVPAASQDPQAEGSGEGAGGAGEDAASGDADGQGAAAGATVKSAVEAYTWDELSQISAEIAAAGDEAAGIEVAKKYNLCTPDGKLDGTQVKSVTLTDGTQTTVQIIGFNHDDKTSGGKAGLTFMFSECIAVEPMEEDGVQASGWEKSYMRSWLAAEGMDMLPDDLSGKIVEVEKVSESLSQTTGSSMETRGSTQDSLWLLSLSEIRPSGSALISLGSEEAVYSYFNIPVDSVEDYGEYIKLSTRTYEGEPVGWWLRTFEPDFSHFYYVTNSGDLGYSDFMPRQAFGVVPGFCI